MPVAIKRNQGGRNGLPVGCGWQDVSRGGQLSTVRLASSGGGETPVDVVAATSTGPPLDVDERRLVADHLTSPLISDREWPF